MAAADAQLKDIIAKALHSTDPVIQKAFQQESALRERTAKELEALLLIQKKLTSETENANQKTAVEFQAAKKATLETLKVDGELMSKLDKALEGYTIGTTAETARYPLKNNKMKFVIEGLRGNPGAVGVTNAHFDKLFAGDVPEGYSFKYDPAAVTVFGDTSSIFGSSKGTFYKTAVINTYLSCLKASGNLHANLSNISLLTTEPGPWLYRSSMVHHTPIPSTLDLAKLDQRFAQFTYTYNNQFHYIHSGYAFGSGRDNSKNPWAAKDCSSWIAEITGCPFIYSTEHQLRLNRFQTKTGILSDDWYNGPEFSTMNDLYDITKDPDKIQAGQTVEIYAHRNFDLKKDAEKATLGSGGHTGIVLGLSSLGKDTKVAVLSYSRVMPVEEGFGVSYFTLFPEPEDKKVMLFSLKGKSANTGVVLAPAINTTAEVTAGASAASITALNKVSK